MTTSAPTNRRKRKRKLSEEQVEILSPLFKKNTNKFIKNIVFENFHMKTHESTTRRIRKSLGITRKKKIQNLQNFQPIHYWTWKVWVMNKNSKSLLKQKSMVFKQFQKDMGSNLQQWEVGRKKTCQYQPRSQGSQ